MLKFEFVQPGEFDNPHYQIINEYGKMGGSLEFHLKRETWFLWWHSDHGLTSDSLDEISSKLKQLNKSTKSQRILGVF